MAVYIIDQGLTLWSGEESEKLPDHSYYSVQYESGTVRTAEFRMNPEEFNKRFTTWCNGTKMQDAFPNFNPDEREFMMTGMVPSEWDNLFPGGDNE